MRWLRGLCVMGGVVALAAAAAASPGAGAFTLTATSPSGSYAATFTGNGLLGVRVPQSGQGYAGGNVPAQSELAGFYAVPSHPTKISDTVQQRANIPTWSTLTFSDGGQTFGPAVGTTSGWRQAIDLRTGIVTTSATWTAPDGHATRLVYQVLTDRANAHVGLVQLQLTPQWSGTASVTDEIDGAPATLTDETAKGFDATTRSDYVAVTTQGTGIEAAIASRLGTSGNVSGTPVEVAQGQRQTIGQQLSFPVTAGQTYTLTKYVGIDDSQDTPSPVPAAQGEAAAAAGTGWPALVHANDRAWNALWQGRIDVLGNRTLATDVNASQFYLWSNTRDGVNWSISPAGLSSNGYDGHIFWDAETWMYPSLLAEHPDLAAGMNNYRLQRLGAARRNASATGYQGARFPWESALDGTEQIPPPTSVNSEGLYEQHITSDVALAQWQYYLVTLNRGWLATQGYPVLSGAAAFWASHATRARNGSYHIDHVTGPDEENPDVNDEAYTNVAAKATLADAVEAARVLHVHVPAAWARIAARIVVPTAGVPRGNGLTGRFHPEFSGYRDQLVKQADVTLLQYPWAFPMGPLTAQNDLNFYVPRSDPNGPSMDDAVNTIDTSALKTPGCASFVFTERSYQPFIRDVFHQFSETRKGGAFTFMTGIGGFLQEFLYGYTGLRWDGGDVRIWPTLTGQLSGVVLHHVQWRGRTFDISVRRSVTTVALRRGAPLQVSTPAGLRVVHRGRVLRIRTARPDLTPTTDAVRCARASASSVQPGAPALAAIDGSPSTDWTPVRLPATLTAAVHGRMRRISHATVLWGREWPQPPKTPNTPPPPRPVHTLRASSYVIQVSANGRSWRTVARIRGVTGPTTDRLRFRPVHARWVRLRISAATQQTMPLLEELTVTP